MSEVLRHSGEVAVVEIEIAISENTRKLPVRIWQHTLDIKRASLLQASLLAEAQRGQQLAQDLILIPNLKYFESINFDQKP